MQTVLTRKAVTMTDLRKPSKVLQEANGSPVAILDRGEVRAYLVPASAVESTTFEAASTGEAMAALKSRKQTIAPVLKYLEDK
ncbi:prevent-host-death family protein [Gallaecimonas pentaromativorans]|uniref:Antitoxin StbD n=1 Tax=Gallaecimonas pentaromativorans TaxID=584787 RepID=A0A3N1P845_9GAMM|nr:prevent-host-death family protein [Gallaecimonas pentaromativorans]ROQ27522.1 hypothetical protein EDC28_104172 [Gallaecimonas pentaromativorans]